MRRWDNIQSPKHRTGVPPARNSQHGLVFHREDFVVLGARGKALSHQRPARPSGGFGRQLPPMQLQALSAGNTWPRVGVPGLAVPHGDVWQRLGQERVPPQSLLCPGHGSSRTGMVGGMMGRRLLPPLGLRHRGQISQEEEMKETKKTRAVGRGHVHWVAWRSSVNRRGHLLTRGTALPAEEVMCAGGCAMGGERAGLSRLPIPSPPGGHTRPQSAAWSSSIDRCLPQ